MQPLKQGYQKNDLKKGGRGARERSEYVVGQKSINVVIMEKVEIRKNFSLVLF